MTFTIPESRAVFVVYRGGGTPYLRVKSEKRPDWEWTANIDKARIMTLPDAMDEAFRRGVTFGSIQPEDDT